MATEMKTNKSAFFIVGTEVVLTDNQVKEIQDIKSGDEVIRFSTVTERYMIGTVGNVSESETNSLIRLVFDDETSITTTDEQSFFVEGKEWVMAKELVLGDSCIRFSSTPVTLTEIIPTIDENTVVYNLLDVVENDTFFANGILVHNK